MLSGSQPDLQGCLSSILQDGQGLATWRKQRSTGNPGSKGVIDHDPLPNEEGVLGLQPRRVGSGVAVGVAFRALQSLVLCTR